MKHFETATHITHIAFLSQSAQLRLWQAVGMPSHMPHRPCPSVLTMPWAPCPPAAFAPCPPAACSSPLPTQSPRCSHFHPLVTDHSNLYTHTFSTLQGPLASTRATYLYAASTAPSRSISHALVARPNLSVVACPGLSDGLSVRKPFVALLGVALKNVMRTKEL